MSISVSMGLKVSKKFPLLYSNTFYFNSYVSYINTKYGKINRHAHEKGSSNKAVGQLQVISLLEMNLKPFLFL